MPWRIGLDEAGYGPNLGPFVMTGVACRVPDPLAGADLWEALKSAARKAGGRADGRIVVDDSKKVYSGGKGFADLEKAALLALNANVTQLGDMVSLVSPKAAAELAEECWYTGTTPTPRVLAVESVCQSKERWKECCAAAGISWLRPSADIVCTPRFNSVIDRHDSKGAVLSLCFVGLLRAILEQAEGEAVHVTVDKHGGRNRYGVKLQDAFPEGWVVIRQEALLESRYEVMGLDRPLHIKFCVEADGREMTVALASMVSKYLREVLMAEWNAYWCGQVPGIKATAGYPEDAKRFYQEIEPTLERLALARESLWRKR